MIDNLKRLMIPVLIYFSFNIIIFLNNTSLRMNGLLNRISLYNNRIIIFGYTYLGLRHILRRRWNTTLNRIFFNLNFYFFFFNPFCQSFTKFRIFLSSLSKSVSFCFFPNLSSFLIFLNFLVDEKWKLNS